MTETRQANALRGAVAFIEAATKITPKDCLEEGKQPWALACINGGVDPKQLLTLRDTLSELADSLDSVECQHCDVEFVASDALAAAKAKLSMESAWQGPAVSARSEYQGERIKAPPPPPPPVYITEPRTKPRGFRERIFGWVKFGPGREKHYHCDVGFPVGFNIARYTRHLEDTLTGSDHYDERRQEKGLPLFVAKDWVTTKTKLITITRASDKALLRYAVRGPWGGRDLTVVIDAATGKLVTGYFNRTDDWHRLTNTNYSNPEED